MTDPPTTRNIQILTHCDPQRAVRAAMLAQSVPLELEIICAINGSISDVKQRMGDIPLPRNLILLPAAREEVYPANALRNRALLNASATWVFYVDTDFICCNNFWRVLISTWQSIQAHVTKLCLCPIALWDPHGHYLSTAKRCNLIENEMFQSHQPPRSWREAERANLFKYHKRCFNDPFLSDDKRPYEITERMLRFRTSFRPPEPWGLLLRDHAVLADEEFGAGPMDKQQFVSALLDRGVRFFAVPEVFIFHLWHPERCEGWPDRARNLSLWLKRHSTPSRCFLLIGVGNVLPPHLHLALELHVLRENKGSLFQSTAVPSSSRPLTESQCIRDMSAQSPVLVGPQYLPRSVLGSQYRVCLFFHSPAFYRLYPEYRPADSRDCGDGSYLLWVARTSSTAEAASRIQNVSVLCDVANPGSCAKALQNLLGTQIPDAWLRDWKATDYTPGSSLEAEYRAKYPIDYSFYDYMGILGRSR